MGFEIDRHANRMIAAPLLAAAICACVTTHPAPANASPHCRDVRIEAVNQTGATIKIVGFDYEGSKRWPVHAIRAEIFEDGQTWSVRQRFERIGGKPTRVRIEYRTAIAHEFRKWSKVRPTLSASQICNDGAAFRVVLQ